MEIHSTKGIQFNNHQPQVMGVESRANFSMRKTHQLHMQPARSQSSGLQSTDASHKGTNAVSGFAQVLQNALQQVEARDSTAKKLTARAVYEPDSVELHQVLLAAEKARFTLNFTKTMTDSLVRGFRELTAPR